jgi:Zn-dependent protease
VKPCRDCGSALAESDLACPSCRSFTHADQLETLAAEARGAAARGDFAAASRAWQSCLALLPEDSAQHEAVKARAGEAAAKAAEHESRKTGIWARIAAVAGPAAFLIWKLKSVLLILVTKGKFLLLGLSKAGTFVSMLAWVGVYWAIYGWPFALGSVLCIYIHEMGHVVALHRYGIPAGAPMFIPGFGAFIRLRQLHLDPVHDARVGLAGPLYGLGATLFCFAVGTITGWKAWSAIAYFSAYINLFNLIPVWQLDGARGWRSLAQTQRMVVVAVAATLWILTSETMLFLIVLACGVRLFWPKDPAPVPDRTGLIQFAGIMVALAILGALSKLHA